MSSYADPGFDGYVVLYCTCLGCIVLYCKYRNTAVVLEPLGRGLGVNGGWNETDFLDYGTCVQSNVFHSILVFVPNIWGVGFKTQKYRCCLCALPVANIAHCCTIFLGHLGIEI